MLQSCCWFWRISCCLHTLSYAINGAYKQEKQRSPVGCTLHGCTCVWDYICVSEIGFLYQCVFLCMLMSWWVKRTQIHRQWEARISDKALRRSGCWRDQRRSNRCRAPEWGRVPLPSAACVTQHAADRGAAPTLQPQLGQERLILTVSVHVSFINCFKSLLVYLCDKIMAPGCTFPFPFQTFWLVCVFRVT